MARSQNFLKRELLKKSFLVFVFFLLLTLYTAPIKTEAQLTGTAVGQVTLTINPAFPEPLSSVLVTAHNNLIDLDRSTIVWYQNGIEKSRGIGKKTFVFNTSTAGSETTIRAFIESPQGLTFNSEIIVRPTVLDLLWEAETTTPLLYKGKALPSSESLVRIVALPHFIYNGLPLRSADLYYEWKVGSRLLSNFSGKGKDTLIINAPKTFGETVVSVKVTSSLYSFSAQKNLIVKSIEPEVYLYQVIPNEGITLRNILGERHVLDGEFSIKGVPYYFSKNKPLLFSWRQNSQLLASQDDQISFSEGSTKLEKVSSISLLVTNSEKLLQFAKVNLAITPQ